MSIIPYKGFTLIEVLVAIGIFVLLSLGITWLLITSLRSNAVIWEQLATQNGGRRVLQQVVDDIRRAEDSSIGSYLIESASSTEFIFFANIDDDTARERIRFFVEGTDFKKGTIEPTGSPLEYDPADEIIVTLAEDVKNLEEGTPTFSFYDENYTGTEAALTEPIDTPDIRVVRIQLELEEDPTQTPVPLHVETTVQIRNLKDEG